ncbi:hypothetical protein EW142_06895 [Flagellimonas allohymeniacidonis]|uniref:Uncharacterized protein n=1 Tax=Flagellimonas allohymeniacidonis TaxID=2517819 RepID=A0A4Q8QGB7_9FLAO|nr:hypothetical protein EW142_06895 [Allomuricauda hymeniacidonis]
MAHLLLQEAVEPIGHLLLQETVGPTEVEPLEELPQVIAHQAEAQEVINLRAEQPQEAATTVGLAEAPEVLEVIEVRAEAPEVAATEAHVAEAEALAALEVLEEVGLLPVGLLEVVVVDEEDKRIHFQIN